MGDLLQSLPVERQQFKYRRRNSLNLLAHPVDHTVRVTDGDAVGAETGDAGRAFTFGQSFTNQVSNLTAAFTTAQVYKRALQPSPPYNERHWAVFVF
ncbi:MAG: hypothetical protein EBS05_11985 [Proteobacteria bacterium]|nr:hypothetical protein [Pseudomonadota bacterium]